MRILIEEYQYKAEQVRDILRGIDALENVDGHVVVSYVGYYFNTELAKPDCVFVLPKVLLEDVGGKELVFGKYRPEDIINIDNSNPLTQTEKDFIYEFAVWIYRAISVFYNDKRNDTTIVYHKYIAQVGKGAKRMSNTFLDILLSLVQFNNDNQNFFFFVLRNLHSGFNKINWTRTIGHSSAIVQNNSPIYLNPINKKKQINFDEELLVIFFSILNYIGDHYGFPKNINCNFDLIKGSKFQSYLGGLGKVRLQQIKYKYFSDKALELWHLCYAFFDASRQISVSVNQKEYLLVKNFNIVFEAIIDELIGDKNIPAGLKEQADGKRVDHMYTYKGLTAYDEDKPIYYIGDSKYYKRGNSIGKESVYKQFTYARNVIQWNLNLFMNGDGTDDDLQADKRNFGHVAKLRDDVTEGYNIIPNFFISARLNKELSYKEEIEVADKQHTQFGNRHFDNRLFDRDTLLICHYDVNFLYVVSLYARNNAQQKGVWKRRVREMFREQIQKTLADKFDFYAMTAHPDADAEGYIKEHFQDVLGKIYTPYSRKDYFSLALDKSDPEGNNEALLRELKKHFFVEKCDIGQDPAAALEPLMTGYTLQGDSNVYDDLDDIVLVATCSNNEHRQWIIDNLWYNVPLAKINEMPIAMKAKYVLLHLTNEQASGHLYSIKRGGYEVWTKEKMLSSANMNLVSDYPREPSSDAYFMFRLQQKDKVTQKHAGQKFAYAKAKYILSNHNQPISFVKLNDLISYVVR